MKREQTRILADVLGDFVKESHLEEGLLQARVCEAWDILSVGRVVLGRHTLRRSFKDGVLTCKIDSSVVRQHLQFQTEALRIQLNRMLSGEIVKQIKLL
ncbi:MAG: DUF721 domain-containing protein [Bacteroidales bacterium]|nr:DUF721 domain-containing protein [Bacteroidales bacterium]